jgi:hypothetical protein
LVTFALQNGADSGSSLIQPSVDDVVGMSSVANPDGFLSSVWKQINDRVRKGDTD